MFFWFFFANHSNTCLERFDLRIPHQSGWECDYRQSHASKELPSVKQGRGRERLSKLDMHNFGRRWDASERWWGWGARQCYCKAVLFIISERSWKFVEFLVWKRAKMKSIFRGEEEDLENHRLVSLKSLPGKVMM